MRHEDVWRALDALAAEHGLSASGLARKAGLDPTAFNPSKRIGADGRARWPSTESVAKVLTADRRGDRRFRRAGHRRAGAVARRRARRRGRRIPLIGLAQAGGGGLLRRWRLSRSAAAGTRSPCPRSATPMPMRSRSRGEFDGAGVPRRRRRRSSPPARRCAAATAWWCAPRKGEVMAKELLRQIGAAHRARAA